jgi:hypothetical protein
MADAAAAEVVREGRQLAAETSWADSSRFTLCMREHSAVREVLVAKAVSNWARMVAELTEDAGAKLRVRKRIFVWWGCVVRGGVRGGVR